MQNEQTSQFKWENFSQNFYLFLCEKGKSCEKLQYNYRPKFITIAYGWRLVINGLQKKSPFLVIKIPIGLYLVM